ILYIENFPVENAGYQNRAYKWKHILFERGYTARVDTIYEDKNDFDSIYQSKWNMHRFFIISMHRKLISILSSFQFETVVVRREVLLFNDYGKLFYQKLLNSIHPNVVLDFDDNISASKNEPREIKSLFGIVMQESGSKFLDSIKLHKRFIVGSSYLKDFVLKNASHVKECDVCIIPTCVDYQKYYYKQYFEKDRIALGWIGGVGNLSLLKTLIPILDKVSKNFPIKLIVISGKEIKADVNFEIVNVPWDLKTEIDEMYKIDVGLMPIENDEVSKGKCGFKLIQYMGLGIVSIASGVTVNNEIIHDGVDSFTVKPGEDWQVVIEKCLSRRSEFQEIGKKAKETIQQRYTFEANLDKYVQFLQSNTIE
ncbi:MAG: glycosyltransferase, partial [Chitinophagales bacterium]|nr:glycosyltransferase [Chitinophagales bacterium]